MQAEIPQPISSVPTRWGGFTTPQLSWVAVGASLPFSLLRLHFGLGLVLIPSAPWLMGALLLAWCRREGRRLDAWAMDWVAFQFQPHRLWHPGSAPSKDVSQSYVEVDSCGVATVTDQVEPARCLPWLAR